MTNLGHRVTRVPLHASDPPPYTPQPANQAREKYA